MQHSSGHKTIFGGLTALAFVLAGCGGDSSPVNGGNGNGNGNGNGDPVETTSVEAGADLQFDPQDILVAPGATVTWTFIENTQHNVTFANTGIQDSGNRTNTTFSTPMPTTPGTYTYQCTIHSGMNGSVTVED